MPSDKEKNPEGYTYESSGVSIDAGGKAVDLIRDKVRSTYNEGVVGDIGGFAGFYQGTFEGMSDPLLVSGTDGVGTKLLMAISSGIIDTVGIDLVAMCTNDIICTGAKPLFFLDYIAVGKNVPERTAAIVGGVADGCRQAGCALIGGEIAEMPDMYGENDFDLAGFCVGVVDRPKIIDGKKIGKGDVLIGLASSGLHSNGYSLVRKILESEGADLGDTIPDLDGKLIDNLLSPTRIYAKTIASIIEKVEIKGIVNITGGGLTENIPRILPEGFGVEIDRKNWERQEIFNILREWGNVETAEMYRVFNMGIGMVLVVASDNLESTLDELTKLNETACVIGNVVAGARDVKYIG